VRLGEDGAFVYHTTPRTPGHCGRWTTCQPVSAAVTDPMEVSTVERGQVPLGMVISIPTSLPIGMPWRCAASVISATEREAGRRGGGRGRGSSRGPDGLKEVNERLFRKCGFVNCPVVLVVAAFSGVGGRSGGFLARGFGQGEGRDGQVGG
jgi:hypothetical protein